MHDNCSSPWRCLILALGPFPNAPQLEKPDCVGIGAAVCYVEKGDSVPRSVVAWIGAGMEFPLSPSRSSGDAFEHRPSECGH